MRDIRIVFNGDNGRTFIDLNKSVSGKLLTAQKCLINIPTLRGSDALYPDKGTTLLQECIGATLVNTTAVTHVANYAALDTLYFINRTDGLDVNDPTGLEQLDLNLLDFDATTSQVTFESIVYFPDGTQTESITNLNTDA